MAKAGKLSSVQARRAMSAKLDFRQAVYGEQSANLLAVSSRE